MMGNNVILIDRERLKEAMKPKSMLELWPQAHQTVEVVAKAPGITIRQLSDYFGWKRNTRQRMLLRLVKEGYLSSKLVPVAGRNGKTSRMTAYWPGNKSS